MKKTPWFNGNKTPVHVGVYETRHPYKKAACVFQHWNGEFWGSYMPSPGDAQRVSQIPSGYQHQPWRGLVEKSK